MLSNVYIQFCLLSIVLWNLIININLPNTYKTIILSIYNIKAEYNKLIMLISIKKI